MSVQVSYKKQTLLGVLILLVIFAVFEIFAQIYHIEEELGCNFVKSEVYKNIPENILIEMCKTYTLCRLTTHNEDTLPEHTWLACWLGGGTDPVD